MLNREIQFDIASMDFDILSDDDISTLDEFELVENVHGDEQRNTEMDDKIFFERSAQKYMKFTDKNPTTYHVIEYFKHRLLSSGFKYINEKELLSDDIRKNIKEGGYFFTVRSNLSIVAFSIGGNWSPENGAAVVASHADALAVKLKSTSLKKDVEGYNMLGVANYSGSLSRCWIDRDLGIGGVVIAKQNGRVVKKLVSSAGYPVAKIPRLAEHFGDIADEPYNKETKMVPIIGYGEKPSASELETKAPLYGKHPISLLRYVSSITSCSVEDILAIDLELFDVQASARGGLDHEFIFASRMDDRLCSFSNIEALVQHKESTEDQIKESDVFSIAAVFNSEEIGSRTTSGAQSTFLLATIERVLNAKNYSSNERPLVYANSAILSVDVTHAFNPDFADAYLPDHYPLPNTGVSVKVDPDGYVATDAFGIALVEMVASRNDLKVQRFQRRNGTASGSTIGPILATTTGARVIDVGLPILSMHSIREASGYKEPGLGIRFFESFFRDWRQVKELMPDY